MPGQNTEYAFETAIEHHLTTAGGYVTGDRDGFDPHRTIFPADVLAFIKASQPDEWAYMEGIQKTKAEETLLDDLCRALVHFAVDTDEVYMTTRLSGSKTYFLPFNKGCGAGGRSSPEQMHESVPVVGQTFMLCGANDDGIDMAV